MYIDSSPPSKPGDKAWLLSIDAFNPTLGSTCAVSVFAVMLIPLLISTYMHVTTIKEPLQCFLYGYIHSMITL